MTLKRFDVYCGGHLADERDYCDDGLFVDADVAQELYDTLELMLTEFNEQMAGIVHDELAVIAKARAALAKARGKAHETKAARGEQA